MWDCHRFSGSVFQSDSSLFNPTVPRLTRRAQFPNCWVYCLWEQACVATAAWTCWAVLRFLLPLPCKQVPVIHVPSAPDSPLMNRKKHNTFERLWIFANDNVLQSLAWTAPLTGFPTASQPSSQGLAFLHFCVGSRDSSDLPLSALATWPVCLASASLRWMPRRAQSRPWTAWGLWTMQIRSNQVNYV